jgi:hypothetical protein
MVSYAVLIRISISPFARLALFAARSGASAFCKSRSRSAIAIFSEIERLVFSWRCFIFWNLGALTRRT